jgi:ZIP family zinc transporter
LYTAATWWLNHRGARHRKRSGHHDEQQPSEGEDGGSGLALAVGALLDGIPESIVVGVSLIAGGGVSLVTVIAIFLSNVPEGLSGAAGMKRSGRSPIYIFGLWGGIMLVSAVAVIIGYTVFRNLGDEVIAGTTAAAAGAILAMLADTMMPKAFAEAHDLAGIITVAGFLAAFVLTKIGG